jgi:hypothetical protein
MGEDMFVVRGVAKELRHAVKQEAAKEGITIRQAVSMALAEWLNRKAEKRQINFKNIEKMKGMIKGGKGEDWSRNIDKIVYG